MSKKKRPVQTPDLKSIPPHPQRAWEYGFDTATKFYEEQIENLKDKLDDLAFEIEFQQEDDFGFK